MPDSFTPTAAHAVDPLLTTTAAGIPVRGGLIVDQIAPVNNESRDEISGKYPILGHEGLQNQAKPVGHFDSFPKKSRTFSTTTYSCVNKGISEEIPLSVRKAASKGAIRRHLDRDRALARCKGDVELGWEIEVAALLTDSANYASGLYENMDTVANRNLDDTSGPGALRLLKEFITTAEEKSNQLIDTLILSADAANYLQTSPNLLANNSAAVSLTLAQIADILEVDRVLRAGKLKAAAGQTAAAAYALSRVWGSNSIIGLCTKDNGEEVPTIWTFLYDWMDQYESGAAAFSWDTEDPWVEHVAYAMCSDVKIAGVKPGALTTINNAFLMANAFAAI